MTTELEAKDARLGVESSVARALVGRGVVLLGALPVVWFFTFALYTALDQPPVSRVHEIPQARLLE